MNLCGNGLSYTKSRFSLNEGYEKLQQETVHLLIGLTIYNFDKIISLHF
jgi:hypothetical protein